MAMPGAAGTLTTEADRWFQDVWERRFFGGADQPEMRKVWPALVRATGRPRRAWFLPWFPTHVGDRAGFIVQRVRILIFTFRDGSRAGIHRLRPRPYFWFHYLEPEGWCPIGLLDDPAALRGALHAATPFLADRLTRVWLAHRGTLPSLTDDEWAVALSAESREVRLAAIAEVGSRRT
jgi:hypothetical protein